MLSEDLTKRVQFLQEMEKLKTVHRTNRTLDQHRRENSAEHSWHVAVMATILQPYAEGPVDIAKVTTMLLIHDIVEIDAGDTWLYAEARAGAPDREAIAAARIYGLLPEQEGHALLTLWREFEARTSYEAKFAAAIDAIQPLLNHLLTRSSGDTIVELEKVRAKKEFVRSAAPRLWPLVESLIAESVQRGLYI